MRRSWRSKGSGPILRRPSLPLHLVFRMRSSMAMSCACWPDTSAFPRRSTAAPERKSLRPWHMSCWIPISAGIYNQAIMDFGATVCTPRNPHCTTCVQQAGCAGLEKGTIEQLPVKEKAVRKKHRCFYYFVVETPEDKVYIRQRIGERYLGRPYEFILYETIDTVWPETILQSDFARQLFDGQALTVRYISSVYRQELSHQRLEGQFITVGSAGRWPIRMAISWCQEQRWEPMRSRNSSMLAVRSKPGTNLVLTFPKKMGNFINAGN